MLRSITAALLLLACTSSTNAQSTDSVLLNYEYAYYHASDDSTRNSILVQKIDYHLQQSELSNQIYLELKRVKSKYLLREEKLRFYWNASVLYYAQANHYRAIHFVDAYESANANSSQDTSFQILKFLTYAEYDTTMAGQLFKSLVAMDSSAECLTCITEVANFELKHKKMRITASYFLPGIGTIVTGKPIKGILSLGLNVLSAAAMVYTIQHQLWVNTAAWGLNLFGKFYTGNIRLAMKVIDEKEMHKKKELATECELQIRSLLQRYPLGFRTSFNR